MDPFEAWAKAHLQGEATERDRRVWVAAATDTLLRCVAACNSERLEESPDNPEDAAYERGVGDCVTALSRIGASALDAADAAGRQRFIAALRQQLQAAIDKESTIGAADLEIVKREALLLAQTRRLVEAVQHYRSKTGLTLMEARDAVTNLLAESAKAAAKLSFVPRFHVQDEAGIWRVNPALGFVPADNAIGEEQTRIMREGGNMLFIDPKGDPSRSLARRLKP